MYYYGQGYAYPQGGYGCYTPTNNNSWGGIFAVVLVLFILLVIIGCGCANGVNNGGI
ncbi:MAG: sporulation protein YjcZ [Bacilli bacterium]|nr:sporulation protein YjcZ [Bacillales bacterium]MDY2574983.1 sporulation protein YjcZ [Bacilli bacterium]